MGPRIERIITTETETVNLQGSRVRQNGNNIVMISVHIVLATVLEETNRQVGRWVGGWVGKMYISATFV